MVIRLLIKVDSHCHAEYDATSLPHGTASGFRAKTKSRRAGVIEVTKRGLCRKHQMAQDGVHRDKEAAVWPSCIDCVSFRENCETLIRNCY